MRIKFHVFKFQFKFQINKIKQTPQTLSKTMVHYGYGFAENRKCWFFLAKPS